MAIKTFSAGSVLTASDTNTYLANSGLVYVTSTTFSGSSSVQVDNCFTSTFDNYRVLVRCTGNTTAFVQFQFRDGSGNVAGSNYRGQVVRAYASTADSINQYNSTSYEAFCLQYGAGTSMATTSCDILNPYPATVTIATHQNFCDNSSAATCYTANGGFLYNANTSLTGFRLVPAGAATITGTVTVYGYRKA